MKYFNQVSEWIDSQPGFVGWFFVWCVFTFVAVAIIWLLGAFLAWSFTWLGWVGFRVIVFATGAFMFFVILRASEDT